MGHMLSMAEIFWQLPVFLYGYVQKQPSKKNQHAYIQKCLYKACYFNCICSPKVISYHLACHRLVGGLKDGRTGEAPLGTIEAFTTTVV